MEMNLTISGKTRNFFRVFLMSLAAWHTHASGRGQNRVTVSGRLTDTGQNPLIGASVIEKGTTNGVSTGIDGDYAIRAAGPESVIEVSYVGYKTVSLVASSSLLAHLTLEEDAMGIDDVVVIGYGSVKKNDMTDRS